MTDLDTALHEFAERWTADEPAPPDLDRALAQAREEARPRWPLILGIAASVVVVAAVAIGVLAARSDHGGDRRPAGRTTASSPEAVRDPAALTAHHWRLAVINDPSHQVASKPDGDSLLIFESGGVDDGHNSGAAVKITTGQLQFQTEWADNLLEDRSGYPLLSIPQSNYVYTWLTGTLSWSITGGTLTITKDGKGSLEYRVTTR